MGFITKFLTMASISILTGVMIVVYFESKMLFVLYSVSIIWILICVWFIMIYIDALEKQIKELSKKK